MQSIDTFLAVDDERGILDAYQNYLVGAERPRIRSSRLATPNEDTRSERAENKVRLLVADTGEKAVELVRCEIASGRPVVGGFFDMKMPGGIDGLETIRRIREIDPNMLYTIVTAYQDRPVDEIAKTFGEGNEDQWDYISKPFTKNEIVQKARNLSASWHRRLEEQQRRADMENAISFLSELGKSGAKSPEEFFDMALLGIMRIVDADGGVLVGEVQGRHRTLRSLTVTEESIQDLEEDALRLVRSSEGRGAVFGSEDMTVFRIDARQEGPLWMAFRKADWRGVRRDTIRMAVHNVASELERRYFHAELVASHKALESKVDERTHALQTANEDLVLQSENLRAALLEVESTKNKMIHQETLAAVGQMAAGVAHEINNPATYIQMNLQDLSGIATLVRQQDELLALHESNKVLSDWREENRFRERLMEFEDLLSESRVGLDRIVRLVKDLLMVGRAPVDKVEKVNAREMVAQVIRIFGSKISGLEVENTLAEDPIVRINRDKIIQVLINLIDNALTALVASAGPKKVLSVGGAFQGDWFELRIADTGAGMSPQTLKRIFEPFFTTKEAGEGTGLGLAISRDILTAHGGTLDAESTVGVGTTFVLRLPKETPLVGDGGSIEPNVVAAEPRAHPRAIIVDDDARVGRAMTRLLKKDYDVAAVTSAKEALAIFEADSAFDFVLCDLMMPQMDGVEFFRVVTAKWPALADRFIFASGGAFTPTAEQFVAENQDRVMKKPVDFAELRRRVNALLRLGA